MPNRSLVEKVAKLASDEFHKTIHYPDEFAKAAIATVLRELLIEMEWGKLGLTIYPGDIRAFAAEHKIAIGEGKEGEKDDH